MGNPPFRAPRLDRRLAVETKDHVDGVPKLAAGVLVLVDGSTLSSNARSSKRSQSTRAKAEPSPLVMVRMPGAAVRFLTAMCVGSSHFDTPAGTSDSNQPLSTVQPQLAAGPDTGASDRDKLRPGALTSCALLRVALRRSCWHPLIHHAQLKVRPIRRSRSSRASARASRGSWRFLCRRIYLPR